MAKAKGDNTVDRHRAKKGLLINLQENQAALFKICHASKSGVFSFCGF